MSYIAGDPLLTVSRQVIEGQATDGQKSVPIPGGCTPGMSDVMVGGATLSAPDFDDSDGMQIKFASALTKGAQYRIVVWAPGQTVLQVGGQMAGFRNRFVNGDARVQQRGPNLNAAAATTTYTNDHWYVYSNGSTAQVQNNAGPPSGIGYGHAIFGAAGNTSIAFGQRIESINLADLAGKTVTVSGWVYLPTAATPSLSVYIPTNKDNYTGGGAWAGSIPAMPACNGSAYSRFSLTFTLPSGATNGAAFEFNSQSPILASQPFCLCDLQIEAGNVATPFERRPVGTELQLAQRYYRRLQNMSAAVSGFTNSVSWSFPFGVTMRTIPAYTTNALTDANYSGGAGPNASQWTFGVAGVAYQAKSSGTIGNIVNMSADTAHMQFSGMVLAAAPNFIAMGANVYAEFTAEIN